MGKKCSACGSTKLLPFEGKDFFDMNGDTSFETKFEGLVCTKCGHIDFYADDKFMKKIGIKAKKR